MGIGVFDISGSDEFAVAEYRVAVRDRKNLGHLMGNKNKGFALITQFAEDTEKVIDFVVGERSRRLIENQQLGICIQRTADFQKLLFTCFQL